MALEPYSWKDKPSFIEEHFPAMKISVESYKEQMAGAGKTLTALGSYWKGRKPLILNKACILGSLLPITANPRRDLEVFELLMAFDDFSLVKRFGRIRPAKIVERVPDLAVKELFEVAPEEHNLPVETPFQLMDYMGFKVNKKGEKTAVTPKLAWKKSISEERRLRIEVQALPHKNYKENISAAKRPEELDPESLHSHIWSQVNQHLGTSANSIPELVEEMGVARFGHRPKVADVFSGSGQIPFEAARLGCDVYASDLNPIACMLSWGAFNIVGASEDKRKQIIEEQEQLAEKVQTEIDALGIEDDGHGWKAKVFLYCVEVTCPQTGWKVPLLPSLIISKPRSGSKNNVVAKLVPVPSEKRYQIEVLQWIPTKDLEAYKTGTVQGNEVVHSPDGVTENRVTISNIRGDYNENKQNRNRLRMWEKTDFVPAENDIFQERLYCVQWIRAKEKGRGSEYEFRSVTDEDLKREQIVVDYVGKHLEEWQAKGYVPDMRIERGYNTNQPIRERGWTHWHHLFNPRQLLVGAIAKRWLTANNAYGFCQLVNWNSRLSRWNIASGGGGSVQDTFYNQALNTLYNYGCRAGSLSLSQLFIKYRYTEFSAEQNILSALHVAKNIGIINDIYITDPPYGDAVKYEEIMEFFIAWLRKNPPPEFSNWTWDSRRALAIKGEDEDFRQAMVAAYKKTGEMMPDNGIQVLMFTHQSGSIWADMANIVWASGLRVTAAWYVVTETDSALRDGAYVKGTILLVLRKRHQQESAFRDDLAYEIQEAVKEQVESLTGLNQQIQDEKSENLYNDADLQMAGYAAALKVLTSYSEIDGKDMNIEALAPRQKGKITFVDELIDFAVQTAVQYLVPVGIKDTDWNKLKAVERYYLKMADLELQGNKTLDNYINFAKALKIKDYSQLMSKSSKANSARLMLSDEFKSSQMSGDKEMAGTPLRALLYAIWEIRRETEIELVLEHLEENCSQFYQNRALLVQMADYLADKREPLKPSKTYKTDKEASAARIIADAIRNQRL